MKKYCIKEEYIHRDEYCHYDDTCETDSYQDDVYRCARDIYDKSDSKSVLDIGCGSGFKLIKYFNDSNSLGLEIDPTLTWLNNKYPKHNWEKSDFNKSLSQSYDIVIVSDVIEHLVDPDELVKFLKTIDFKYAVISTPERDAIQQYQRGYTWNGPPNNPAHLREWTHTEFRKYMLENFDVVGHYMSKNKCEIVPLCQIVIVMNK